MTHPAESYLDDALTEGRNSRSTGLDQMGTAALLRLMNAEDGTVAGAVEAQLDQIGRAVELATVTLKAGGRLIYIGAGTSGRLGVLDAAECVPTFGMPPGRVVGVIAGGETAMFAAQEGVEDSLEQGRDDLARIGISDSDFVVGIAASGRTPYVVGALRHAKLVGARTAALSCNPGAPISSEADVAIEVSTGPEVLTGSTRLKAGTAQKLVLNMISTATMVGIGKAYDNLMVDLVPTNAKLALRAERIVREATGCDAEAAVAALNAADGHAKTAIVMTLAGIDAATASARLDAAGGLVRAALTSTDDTGVEQ